ncbi:hypothetical protein LI089_11605 [Alistipes communis]|uniref:hypothetical protein n=2 Tax=Alistipes communis TaxID=2585118 RepID=UPI001D05F67E|nr:hypothetical protein [Alistipes communis]MCB6996982.1 hypothetical protein [Alistipes communis]
MQKFLENYLVDSKKGFTFAPLSAPKTGGEVLKKLRKKKFFKNLVDSKKGFTFAPLSAPKISGKVSEKWFFELLVNLRKSVVFICQFPFRK